MNIADPSYEYIKFQIISTKGLKSVFKNFCDTFSFSNARREEKDRHSKNF